MANPSPYQRNQPNQPGQKPYDRFGRKIDESSNPTIDAAGEAYDTRVATDIANQERSVAEKQAQFQAEANNRENNIARSNQNRGAGGSPSMNAQAGFREKAKMGSEAIKEALQSGLSPAWFGVALLFAGIFDAASFFINAIPVIGGVLSSFIVMPIGMGILWLIHKLNGGEFSKKIRNKFVIAAVIEFIPIINALPAFIALVILCKAEPVIKSVVDQVGGPVGGSISELDK